MKHKSKGLLAATLLSLFINPSSLRAEPPKILDFQVQVVKQKTYFHIVVEEPADMAPSELIGARWFDDRVDLALADTSGRPRLVPQDEAARLVYFGDPNIDRLVRGGQAGVTPQKQRPKMGGSALDFYGVFTGNKPASFLFLYPKAAARTDGFKFRSLGDLLKDKGAWVEEKILLDPAKARAVPLPGKGFERDGQTPVSADDLEGNWALTQAWHFAVLEAQTPGFGFFGFARAATNQKYKVRGPEPLARPAPENAAPPDVDPTVRREYELTTGATAITESLALERMRQGAFAAKAEPEKRVVPIESVTGIDIAEHPWKQMLEGKVPVTEPLAKLVPHDNYYIHFKTFAKFLEASDLLDEGGTPVARAYEVQSRDYRVKQKLERQLCLKSTGLARVFGPAVIKELAITGNDPYLREGSDVTIIFGVVNKTLFQGGAEPMLAEAKAAFGKALRAEKAEYQGVTIESFVTPLREVSLHRAFFDDVAVYSNSGVALRRVIDARQSKIKRLADALDFQYMRTVFRAADPAEDGFAYLSDAFIRNLVGPAVRIKERRRLEALTGLNMVTHCALFAGWESGVVPASFEQIKQAAGLQPHQLNVPEGNTVAWDDSRKIAQSSLYNTQHFATPLIEIPISHVTQTEQREYEQFRLQYLGLWRQYFDPIGIRMTLGKSEIKTEIYILPLVRTSAYNDLRRIAGNGTIKVDPSIFSERTLGQYMIHLAPKLLEHELFGGVGRGFLIDMAVRSWLGDWCMVRADDSPVYAKLLESYIRSEMFPSAGYDLVNDLKLLSSAPMAVGVHVRSPVVFAGVLAGVRKTLENTLPGAVEWAPLEQPYKGVPIVRIKATGVAELDLKFYYAMIDDGFFVSLREEPIKDIIDRSAILKGQKADGVDVNSSLFLRPQAAVKAKGLVNLYLEYETHRRAQANNRLLYALFRSHVVSPAADNATIEAAALQYLGFIPVSPDLAPFRYDNERQEVSNLRHGSARQPKLNLDADANTPLAKMLEQFATIRADLRFREDGIHTTLTMSRKR